MELIDIGTNKAIKEEFVKWIQALRSGEFNQAKGALETDNGYCCMGVACEILIPKDYLTYPYGLKDQIYGNFPGYHLNAPQWLKSVNMCFENVTGKSLSTLNDWEGYTFDEIADLLEAVYIEKVLE